MCSKTSGGLKPSTGSNLGNPVMTSMWTSLGKPIGWWETCGSIILITPADTQTIAWHVSETSGYQLTTDMNKSSWDQQRNHLADRSAWRTHRTQLTVIFMAIIYYSERIERKINKGKCYMGQSPEETNASFQESLFHAVTQGTPNSSSNRLCQHIRNVIYQKFKHWKNNKNNNFN